MNHALSFLLSLPSENRLCFGKIKKHFAFALNLHYFCGDYLNQTKRLLWEQLSA
ncbi:putative uncharacterized protein [Bacteroides intestinalis CAG:315]|nr:putative uncharacterized protein [Bacteroides intestinalis CAG:315]